MFEDLIARGLVKEKKYPNGLSVFKYTRRVFYDALWNEDPLLLEARGMVLDTKTGEKVIWPFTKVFNYKENGAGEGISPYATVEAVRKVNGFMAAAAWYNGELIVSTTGTLDSDFAIMARKYIERLNIYNMMPFCTYIFEICSPDDPHIVEEEEGAYLIGLRHNPTGRMWPEAGLENTAEMLGAKRPERQMIRFDALEELVSLVQHEGFMVRDADTGETLFKWKSPHYLTKKFLMRMGEKKVDAMYTNPVAFRQTIDEEYYDLVDYIMTHFCQDFWVGMNDQDRRRIIEEYFEGEK